VIGTGGGLVVEHLTVRFGGLVAIGDLTLTAPQGVITGLIGPNGAGKTTTFNACTGVVVSSGRISLDGQDLSRLAPPRRARVGLGRTFQRIELCDRLTVAENVALGPEALASGRRPWGQLAGGRAERAEVAARAEEAMGRVHVLDLRDANAGELSTGQRRFVELARAIASGFRFLLLDEPSSGLDIAETERLADTVAAVTAERGIGVVLVEHDMALVRRVCEFTGVLDFGTLIASGPTAEVLSSDLVRAAYLGSVEAESRA
jgi:ABC-type branched-subunit amino acid transport system ATPase component